MRRAIIDRRINNSALPRGFRLQYPSKHAAHQIHRPAADIADKRCGRYGRILGSATIPKRARHRDVIQVMPSRMCQRPALPPARHTAKHKRRVHGVASLRPEAKPFHHARSEPLNQRICARDELHKNGLVVSVLQVKLD